MEGDKIPVFANELDSVETQLNFEYYYLNFCRSTDTSHSHENLGSVILGESTQLTPYDVNKHSSTF